MHTEFKGMAKSRWATRLVQDTAEPAQPLEFGNSGCKVPVTTANRKEDERLAYFPLLSRTLQCRQILIRNDNVC
jgi:hypothetical protein